MTKDTLIRKILDSATSGNSKDAYEAINEFSKQQSISYSIFKREYQIIEGMNYRHDVNEKLGGMTSWIGASDEKIWEAYKSDKQLLRWIENPKHPDNLLKKV